MTDSVNKPRPLISPMPYMPDEAEDDLTNACSACDCTGLIPTLPENDAQLEAYEDVYAYRPPEPGTGAADF